MARKVSMTIREAKVVSGEKWDVGCGFGVGGGDRERKAESGERKGQNHSLKLKSFEF